MLKVKRLHILLLALMLALALVVAGCGGGDAPPEGDEGENGDSGEALDYPNKAVKLVVPWKAGGDTDAILRTIGKYLEEELGQPVIISNVEGGGGSIGAQEAMGAKPDGYTLLAIHDSVGLSYVMGKTDFGYFDFDPVALMVTVPDIVATSSANPWNTMEDVVKDAKERPGELTFGATIGSTSHYTPAAIEVAADIEFNIVGYEGTADRMTALLGQHLDFGSVTVPAGKEYVAADKINLLGIAWEERHPGIPDVPTLKEQGIDVVCGTNRGIVVPKGTDEGIIQILRDALKRVAENPDFIADMDQQGVLVNYKGDDYVQYLKDSENDLREVAEKANMMEE